MTKTLKKFKVNAVIKVNFPIYVIAENEEEAISKCEDNIGESNLEIYSDTVGISLPSYETFDDDAEVTSREIDLVLT